jgi:hypothetical protein
MLGWLNSFMIACEDLLVLMYGDYILQSWPEMSEAGFLFISQGVI